MAGSTHNTSQLPVINQWQVQYARFINCSSTPSRCSLSPVATIFKKGRGRGTWISTATASVKIIYEPSSNGPDEVLLRINLNSRLLEEHYISKMHFSWPQVSCVSGCPARGTKAVFVSYKDGLCQIQKFVLRFPNVLETEKFINILKETQCLQSSKFYTELSFQAEIVPSDGPIYRQDRDWQDSTSTDICTQPIFPVLDYRAVSEFISSKKTQDPEDAETMHAIDRQDSTSTDICTHLISPVLDYRAVQESVSSKKTQYLEAAETMHATAWQDSTSTDICTQPIFPILDHRVSTSSKKTQDPEAVATMSAFPPSFIQLLKNCQSAVEAKPTDSDENLKTQLMRYLEETSFEELLFTLENVMSELGDDLVL